MKAMISAWQAYCLKNHNRVHARLRAQFPDYDHRIERMLAEGLNLGQAFPGADFFSDLPIARHHHGDTDE
jgi:predicted ester cyclase